jgi:hypothetical protein
MSVFTDSIPWTASKSCSVVGVTILAGTNISNGVFLGSGLSAIAIEIPLFWWNASPIGFSSSMDGITWYAVWTSGGEYSVAAPVAGYRYNLDINIMCPWRWLRIRSGTSAAPANQLATVFIPLICKVIE